MQISQPFIVKKWRIFFRVKMIETVQLLAILLQFHHQLHQHQITLTLTHKQTGPKMEFLRFLRVNQKRMLKRKQILLAAQDQNCVSVQHHWKLSRRVSYPLTLRLTCMTWIVIMMIGWIS